MVNHVVEHVIHVERARTKGHKCKTANSESQNYVERLYITNFHWSISCWYVVGTDDDDTPIDTHESLLLYTLSLYLFNGTTDRMLLSEHA